MEKEFYCKYLSKEIKAKKLLNYVKQFKKEEIIDLINKDYCAIKGNFPFDALVGYKSAYLFATTILAMRFLGEKYGKTEKIRFDRLYLLFKICLQFCGEIFGLMDFRYFENDLTSISYQEIEDVFTYLENNCSEEIQELPFSKGGLPDKFSNTEKQYYLNMIYRDTSGMLYLLLSFGFIPNLEYFDF